MAQTKNWRDAKICRGLCIHDQALLQQFAPVAVRTLSHCLQCPPKPLNDRRGSSSSAAWFACVVALNRSGLRKGFSVRWRESCLACICNYQLRSNDRDRHKLTALRVLTFYAVCLVLIRGNGILCCFCSSPATIQILSFIDEIICLDWQKALQAWH